MSETSMTYREKRERRAERLREWADKREAKASAGFEKASKMAEAIPFGQPILVGHHSEGRDRRYRDRIDNTARRAIEDADKARSMAGRADGIEAQLGSSVYDDDPDAVEQLTERIADLEAQRERIKAYNATCRKGAPDTSLLDDRQRRRYVDRSGGGPLPSYVLQNLGGNIKRNRDRLASLKVRQQRAEASEQAGGTLVEDCGHGYVRVTFAAKPERSVLDALKAAGFRWGKGSWSGLRERLPEGIET